MIRDIITGYPSRAIATGQKMPQTHQKNACFSMPKETHDRMAVPLVHKQYVILPLAK
jgi:hypothetical protein